MPPPELPKHPVDSILESRILKAETDRCGWALEIAKDEKGVPGFKFTQDLPKDDEYRRPSDLRRHTLHDVDSFVAFCGRYGTKEKSLVMYRDDGATLIIDETLERGQREAISLIMPQTAELKTWVHLLGKRLTHKELVGNLTRLAHTLDDPSLLLAARQVSFKAEVDSKSAIQETAKEVGVIVSINGKEGLANFPKTLKLRVPVLEEDALDESLWASAQVQVIVHLPDNPTDGLQFELLCPTFGQLVRKRTAEVAEGIRGKLAGWLVVRGVHFTERRQIGEAARRAA